MSKTKYGEFLDRAQALDSKLSDLLVLLPAHGAEDRLSSLKEDVAELDALLKSDAFKWVKPNERKAAQDWIDELKDAIQKAIDLVGQRKDKFKFTVDRGSYPNGLDIPGSPRKCSACEEIIERRKRGDVVEERTYFYGWGIGFSPMKESSLQAHLGFGAGANQATVIQVFESQLNKDDSDPDYVVFTTRTNEDSRSFSSQLSEDVYFRLHDANDANPPKRTSPLKIGGKLAVNRSLNFANLSQDIKDMLAMGEVILLSADGKTAGPTERRYGIQTPNLFIHKNPVADAHFEFHSDGEKTTIGLVSIPKKVWLDMKADPLGVEARVQWIVEAGELLKFFVSKKGDIRFEALWEPAGYDDLGPLTIKVSKSFLSDDENAPIRLTELYIDPQGNGNCP